MHNFSTRIRVTDDTERAIKLEASCIATCASRVEALGIAVGRELKNFTTDEVLMFHALMLSNFQEAARADNRKRTLSLLNT